MSRRLADLLGQSSIAIAGDVYGPPAMAAPAELSTDGAGRSGL